MQKTQQLNGSLKTEDLIAFASVVENDGFAGAARIIGRNATVLSRRIQHLEMFLGIRLLARSTRHVALTEAGELFYSRIRGVLDDLHNARLEVSEFANAPGGLLRVSLPVTFGRRCVAPAIKGFVSRYPGIKLDLRFTDRLTDLVAENVDIAIRVGQLTDSALMSRTISQFKFHLVASPAYFEQHAFPQTPDDLASHHGLKFLNNTLTSEWVLTDENVTVKVMPDGPVQSDSSEALLQAALDGLGIALLPDWLTARDLHEKRLLLVLPGWRGKKPGGIHAIMPPGRLIPAKTRVFIDHILAHATEQWV